MIKTEGGIGLKPKEVLGAIKKVGLPKNIIDLYIILGWILLILVIAIVLPNKVIKYWKNRKKDKE